MITCPACGKQNQDHYRFCLGCGSELPRGVPAPAPVPEPTVEEEETYLGQAPAMVAPVPAPPPPELAPGTCPECGYVNPTTNRFCASCGFRLEDAAKAAPKAVAKPEATGEQTAATLVALDPTGNEVGRHPLGLGQSVIGRETGGMFATDSFLSPQHAVFRAERGSVWVRDAGSLNGVFRKLLADQRAPLRSGQRFRIGQELMQYEGLDGEPVDPAGVSRLGSPADGVVGRVSLVVGRNTVQPSHPVPERGLNLGRERGDILFPEDGYVSGLHCHLGFEGGAVWVTDLGSSNGTFVQLVDDTELRNGDVLLMGQQLFRIML